MERNVNVKGKPLGFHINVKEGQQPNRSYGKVHKRGSQLKISRAQHIADELVRRFGPASNSCYAYFCKCAYRLSESVIWACYEDCQKPSVGNKLAYFLSATKAQPEMR